MKRAYTDEHAAPASTPSCRKSKPGPTSIPITKSKSSPTSSLPSAPRPALPDFGKIVLRYVPDKRCLELKSYKMYLLAYRNLGIFQENVVNRVLRDVVKAANPKSATVIGDFSPRGGWERWSRPPGAGRGRGRVESAELIAILREVRERVRAGRRGDAASFRPACRWCTRATPRWAKWRPSAP